MYFVQCPRCGEPVEVPAYAVAENCTDPCQITACDLCDLTFGYGNEEVELVLDSSRLN